MRRFKSLLHPVIAALSAFASFVTAPFASRNVEATSGAHSHGSTAKGAHGRTSWQRRGALAVPFVAVLAIGATAFAAGAGTPGGTANTAGHRRVRAAATTVTPTTKAAPSTTKAPTTTAAPTTTKAPATTAAPTTVAPVSIPPTTTPPTTAAPVTVPAPVQVSTHGACGGNLPPCCVMMRESGGNPTAVNASSGASGKWQFMPSTWANYGGYPTAASAPEAVQDARAAQIWAGGAGASHWGGGCW